MVSERFMYAASQVSWSSIFAGGITAFSLSILLAILGVALGFTVIRPKSDHPLAGIGIAFGGWAFISTIVSMAGGGFVGGLFAGQRGLEHGFLVWALALVVAIVFGGIATGVAAVAATRAVGSTLKMVGAGAGAVASAAGRGAAHVATGAIDELRGNVHLNLDTDKLTENVVSVLHDTGMEKLQPEYLQQQMREARSDLRHAVHQLTLTPSKVEDIVSRFLEKQKGRLESLTGDIDRESAVTALAKVRNMPREEAEALVSDAVGAYEHVVEKARESLADARAQVEDAREYLKGVAEQAREKADKAASAAARAALLAGLALILAAVVSMGSGMCGEHYSAHWHPVQATYSFR